MDFKELNIKLFNIIIREINLINTNNIIQILIMLSSNNLDYSNSEIIKEVNL